MFSFAPPCPELVRVPAQGAFVPVRWDEHHVQRHRQSCSHSTLLLNERAANKLEEVEGKVKK